MSKQQTFRIITLQVGEYGNNSYILIDPLTLKSGLIDAAADAEKIIEQLKDTDLQFILTTHSHQDHWGALSELKAKFPDAKIGAHKLDSSGLPEPVDLNLNHGDTLLIGNIPLRVIHTPGHTDGSLCFVTGDYLFTGDTLFPGGPGHSTSSEALSREIESIVNNLYVLDRNINILPGHGPTTTIKDSMMEYKLYAARDHTKDLYGDILWNEK
jgi:glyoxylase-like metal-dependent hydrolase (beta-lactamase superfamily II)